MGFDIVVGAVLEAKSKGGHIGTIQNYC